MTMTERDLEALFRLYITEAGGSADLWERMKAAAEQRGITITRLLLDELQQYVERHGF